MGVVRRVFNLIKIRETVRVPPKNFTENLSQSIQQLAQSDYEGYVDEDQGLVIAVTSVENIGDGMVVPGDAAAYYEADITLLMYKPVIHEVVKGWVTEATEFGAFVRVSPIEGLVHVSQIADDFITFDAKLPGFVGKRTNKRLVIDDVVICRIVSVSLKGNIQNSKIGLTMRQPFLGKEDEVKKELKEGKKKSKTPDAPKKEAAAPKPKRERQTH